MRTAFLIILLILGLSSQCQIKIDDPVGTDVSNDLKISDSLKEIDVSFMKLFRFNPENNCNQSKSLKIIYRDSISKCFDFIENLGVQKSKKIISLLNSKSTFGNENFPCFSTEYVLIAYDKNSCIIGTISISLKCNKVLLSYYNSSLEYYRSLKFSPIGLSENSRSQLIKMCHLKE